MSFRLIALTPTHRRWLLPLLALLLLLFTAHRLMQPAAYAQPFTSASDLALLSEKGVLARNINLKTFEPHRDAKEFTCRMQAERLPPLSPAAQALHEEAMTLTSPALWPNERNWPRAMQLWQQAAQQGHWKAALMWLQTARTGQGVNSEKGQFAVPASAPEEVVMATERLMQLGLGDAFYWMGQFHQSGDGVRPSEDRAWAFWELAADMGSPLAQTEIAKALGFVDRDQEKPNVAEWANRPLMFSLLECAHAQGYGQASHLLGFKLATSAKYGHLRQPRFPTPEAQYRYALQVLHDGVKFGSEAAANYLYSSFEHGAPLVSNFIDKVRADRYSTLGDALWHNPDLRFPNLDRVIPLPPAKLPQWDSQPDSLIQAAQGVRAVPGPAKTSEAPGRARVPVGYAVPAAANTQTPLLKGLQWNPREGSTIALAPREGYYQPVLLEQDRSSWPERLRNLPETYSDVRRREVLATAPPLYYRAGEPLSLASAGLMPFVAVFMDTARDHEGVRWRYLGPAQAHAPAQDNLARAGLVHAIAQATDTLCPDGAACPTTGIWQPEVSNAEHPLAKVFNATLAGESWRRQAWVRQGEKLPTFSSSLAPVLTEGEAEQLQVKWRLMVACELGFEPVGGGV